MQLLLSTNVYVLTHRNISLCVYISFIKWKLVVDDDFITENHNLIHLKFIFVWFYDYLLILVNIIWIVVVMRIFIRWNQKTRTIFEWYAISREKCWKEKLLKITKNVKFQCKSTVSFLHSCNFNLYQKLWHEIKEKKKMINLSWI